MEPLLSIRTRYRPFLPFADIVYMYRLMGAFLCAISSNSFESYRRISEVLTRSILIPGIRFYRSFCLRVCNKCCCCHLHPDHMHRHLRRCVFPHTLKHTNKQTNTHTCMKWRQHLCVHEALHIQNWMAIGNWMGNTPRQSRRRCHRIMISVWENKPWALCGFCQCHSSAQRRCQSLLCLFLLLINPPRSESNHVLQICTISVWLVLTSAQ